MRKLVIVLCLLSMVGMAGWKLSEGVRERKAVEEERTRVEREEELLLLQSSDARRFARTITVMGDGWLGYLVFRSRLFQEEMVRQGLGLKYLDEPDYQKRYAALADGTCDLALGTVDSYLLKGAAARYPGVISWVVDESYGGDAVVGRAGLSSIDDLRTPGLKGALVGFSPSEFLLKTQAAHFGLENIRKRVPEFRVDRDVEALNKFQRGEVDFAVLWEPHLTTALREVKGAKVLLDSSKLKNLIVDVVLASRRMAAEESETLQRVAESYFRVLARLEGDPELFRRLAMADARLSSEAAERTLAGIRMVSYGTNLRDWYGIHGHTEERLIRALSGVQEVLLNLGELPQAVEGAALTNSRTLEALAQSPGVNEDLLAGAGKAQAALGAFFPPLSDEQWHELADQATGTLLEKAISFRSGSATIPEEFQEELRLAASRLAHYPYHRLIAQAHVSPGQDEEVDLALSQERAEALRQFLVGELGLAPGRVHAVGKGARVPLRRREGESLRAWKRRSRRARILIATD